MRTIKFRGKRKNWNPTYGQSEWKFGNLLNNTSIGEVGYDMDSYEYALVVPETVGQFIGLTDKTGTAIFEDDLVEKNGVVYKITWNSLHAMWGLFTKSGQSNEEIVCDTTDEKGNICKFWQDSTLTIIGNIHDNPELLK